MVSPVGGLHTPEPPVSSMPINTCFHGSSAGQKLHRFLEVHSQFGLHLVSRAPALTPGHPLTVVIPHNGTLETRPQIPEASPARGSSPNSTGRIHTLVMTPRSLLP